MGFASSALCQQRFAARCERVERSNQPVVAHVAAPSASNLERSAYLLPASIARCVAEERPSHRQPSRRFVLNGNTDSSLRGAKKILFAPVSTPLPNFTISTAAIRP